MKKWTICIERTRTLTEIVEVEIAAKDAEAAEEKALNKAEYIPDKDWSIESEDIGELSATDVTED